MDEVFLPADVRPWTEPAGLANAISDDQIGRWLDRLREKGAHVFAVFDCCHSGTMTRGKPGPHVREVNRAASPAALNVKEEAIRDAVRRAERALAEARAAGRPVPSEVNVHEQKGNTRGSLAAFYAAQPFEEAPELPFPEGADRQKENYYGMLSWTLVQTIRARRSPLRYEELERLVSTSYSASRSPRPPHPFAEGDLSREMLSLSVWPSVPAILVQRGAAGDLQINAGLLQGIRPGAILAVVPPAVDAAPQARPGYLKVISSAPNRASVVPIARESKDDATVWREAPLDGAAVPDSARCEIVASDISDMQVSLFVDPSVKAAFDRIHPTVKSTVVLTADETDAECLLLSETRAVEELAIQRESVPQVYLCPARGRRLDSADEQVTAEHLRLAGRPLPRKILGVYRADDMLVAALERDLPKIFQWRNVWRVVREVQERTEGKTYNLKFEVARLKDENDRTGGQLLRDGVLVAGQEVEFRLKNEGNEDLWVSAYYLEANFGIARLESLLIPAKTAMKPIRAAMSVRDNSFGTEGIVVFAIPTSLQPQQPKYEFLEQEPLNAVSRVPRQALNVPLSTLVRTAAASPGARNDRAAPSTVMPAILTQSWVLVRDK